MTCYLNSLVQSLYMTPEFRNAIYKWVYTVFWVVRLQIWFRFRWEYRSGGKSSVLGEREARSIPYQIQKLFLLLQTSDLGSLETKDLTASFGWSSNEGACRLHILISSRSIFWNQFSVRPTRCTGVMSANVRCFGVEVEGHSKREADPELVQVVIAIFLLLLCIVHLLTFHVM